LPSLRDCNPGQRFDSSDGECLGWSIFKNQTGGDS
jgi:hypothetical protein